MANLSNYLENALLDHLWGRTTYTPPSTLYLQFFSSAPDYEEGTGGTAILASRISITNDATNWPAATNGAKSNGVAIETPVNSSGSSWSLVGWALYDASTSGNMLIGKSFASPYTVAVGEKFRFEVGDLDINFTITGYSNYLNSELVDHVLSAATFTAPATLYFAALTTAPSSYATFSGAVEASAGNYARASATNNTTTFSAASSGDKTTAVDINYVTPNANWGTIVAIGVYDASTTGNALCGFTLASSKAATSGTPLSIKAGDFDLTLA